METRAAGADDRRRQARGDARRQQILDAAVELFAARGYRGTGLTPLAEKVGLTHPGLLYYFGTKERLLTEVVEERQRAEVQAFPRRPSWEGLRSIARVNANAPTLVRLYAVLAMENLDAEDPLHAFFVSRNELAREMVGLSLEAEFGPLPDREQLSVEVLGAIIGIENQWLIDPERIDLIAAMDAYLESLHRRLADRTAAS